MVANKPKQNIRIVSFKLGHFQKIIINGGRPLNGSIHISGSKNASLPIMAACILTNDQLELSNIPNLDDVKTMSKVLSSLGVEVNEDNISKNKE